LGGALWLSLAVNDFKDLYSEFMYCGYGQTHCYLKNVGGVFFQINIGFKLFEDHV